MVYLAIVNTYHNNNDSLTREGEENLAESILRDALGDRERESILRVEGHLDGLYVRRKSLAEELERLMGEERYAFPAPKASKVPVKPKPEKKPWFIWSPAPKKPKPEPKPEPKKKPWFIW